MVKMSIYYQLLAIKYYNRMPHVIKEKNLYTPGSVSCQRRRIINFIITILIIVLIIAPKKYDLTALNSRIIPKNFVHCSKEI